MKFIKSLAELLRRLLDYRAVPHGDEYRDLHMHVVFNLLVSEEHCLYWQLKFFNFKINI